MQAISQLFAPRASPKLHEQIQGFSLPAPEKATNASSLSNPWQTGGWRSVDLSPFDNANFLEKETSGVLWCGQKNTSASGSQRMDVVPCSDCPIGYKVDTQDSRPLLCRDLPVPNKTGACTDCQLSALQPWAVGTCNSCISYGINPVTGTCACNEF